MTSKCPRKGRTVCLSFKKQLKMRRSSEKSLRKVPKAVSLVPDSLLFMNEKEQPLKEMKVPPITRVIRK